MLSIYHRSTNNQLGESRIFIYQYAEDSGYRAAGLSHKGYIDGIGSKDAIDEWLTEVRLLIE